MQTRPVERGQGQQMPYHQLQLFPHSHFSALRQLPQQHAEALA